MVSQLQRGIRRGWNIMLHLQETLIKWQSSLNLLISYPLRAWKVKRVQMMAKGRMKVRLVAASLQNIKASLQDVQAFSTRDLV